MADRGYGAGVAGADRLSELDGVLVVTVRKSFWASTEAARWPRRLYARVYRGHSTALVNSVPVFVRALLSIWLHPPRIVLLGSVERTVPWFLRARRLRLLRGARLVVTNQLNLTPAQLEQVDRVIVYASAQAAALGEKGIFLPLPADGDFEEARRTAEPGGYVFSGGGAGRDFSTLIDAVRETDLRLELVVFDRDALERAPTNVVVHGPVSQAEFLRRLASASIVVVPLESAESPHGQTLVVQALALGKPVVATRAVGTVDYVDDGVEGSLVEARDANALRHALERLAHDADARTRLGEAALRRAAANGYGAFSDALVDLSARLLVGESA